VSLLSDLAARFAARWLGRAPTPVTLAAVISRGGELSGTAEGIARGWEASARKIDGWVALTDTLEALVSHRAEVDALRVRGVLSPMVARWLCVQADEASDLLKAAAASAARGEA
jgi:hypothetical protein